MNLHLPQLTLKQAEIEQSPNTLRAAKRWQSELPLVNMGETTRLFYLAIRSLNRQPLPARLRLDLMEQLYSTAQIVLQHLNKHLKVLTHPLAGKIKQISRLNEALLLEMSVGYKHVVYTVATHKEKLDNRSVVLAAHRAMRFLEMALAHNARTYRTGARSTWHDLHRLEAFVEQYHLSDTEVKDDLYNTIDESTARDVYKQACLLAMAQPLKLRTGEVEKLQSYFEKASHLCVMKKSLSPDENGMVHVASLKSSEPPAYIPLADITTFSNLRGFDLSRLISTMNDMIEDEGDTGIYQIPKKGEVRLDSSLIKRLIKAWTTQEKRRYSRVLTNRSIVAAVGIKNIINAINADINPELSREELFIPVSEYDAQETEDASRFIGDMAADTEQFEHPLPSDSMVYYSELIGVENHDEQPAPRKKMPGSWREWRVINTGAGGYGIAWDKEEASGVQVGEVISLREKEYNIHHWRTGVVRWLHNSDERGLEVGLQLLAPRAIVVSVETIRNRSYSQIMPMDALMLPGMKTLQYPPSLLVPNGVFKSGDILDIAMLGKKLHIELRDIGEAPSFFTQFFYTSSEVKSTVSKKEEFEDLWKRL
ncbi:MAG TPA: hypothetical protein ENJ35_06210 [Gammaproteobacteria bacterium]|nr:hypothetical protein [Gammaproteobacteria bacterium]